MTQIHDSFLENIVMEFRIQNVLMSIQGTHFINYTIKYLNQYLMIHHRKIIVPYHPQVNGTTNAFNKIL
jgi:hypothetical protein